MIYLSLAAATVGADLWSKHAIFDRLEVSIIDVDGIPRIVAAKTEPVVENWFELEAVLNYGAFSGWFASVPWLLVAISLAAVVVTTLMIAVPAVSRKVMVVALGLVAGGALGNLYDRTQIGAVRDFLKVFYVGGDGQESVWPNFNLADSGICVGVGLILVAEFFGSKKEPKPSEAEPKE